MQENNAFSIDILEIHGDITPERSRKLVRAIVHAHDAVNSDEFKDFFIKEEFTQVEKRHSHLDNKDFYKVFIRAVEFNYFIDKRSFWKRFSKVLGWEDAKGVHTYQDVYDSMSVSALAGHLVHEAAHALGFTHEFNWSPERDYSVPYRVGNWVESYCQNRKREEDDFIQRTFTRLP